MRRQEKKRILVSESRRVADLGLVTATDGNLSLYDGKEMMITPTHIRKDSLYAKDLIEMTLDGVVLTGGAPSTEWRFHKAVYDKRHLVGAVCNAHPVFSTALCDYIYEIGFSYLLDARYRFRKAAIIPETAAGSEELAQAVKNALTDPQVDVVFLKRHGVITFGQHLSEAVDQMDSLERYARTLWILKQGHVSNNK